jgi:hypothetical protein
MSNKPQNEQRTSNKLHEFICISNRIEHFIMPDGTMVSLAPGEKISMPPGASITKRLMKLKKIRKV